MNKKTNLLVASLGILLMSCAPTSAASDSSASSLIGNMLEDSYAILLPAEASSAEIRVAQELADTFTRCTGKSLSLERQERNGVHYISIGNTSLFQETSKKKNFDLSKKTLNEDGFVLYTSGEDLLINGYNDRGITYGVYEFLENTLGVRYLSGDYTYYPTLDKANLYSIDKTFVPSFSGRAYLNTPVFQNNFPYVSHMRFNTDYAVMPENYGGSSLWHKFGIPAHTVGSIVPYKNYLEGGADTNGNPLLKEEYREVYQHRYSDAGVTNHWYLGALDLCYTNGVDYNQGNPKSTLELMIASLKNILEEDRTCEFLHIGQEDVPSSCPCSHCRESANKYRASGVMIRFMNEIEERVNAWLRETQNGREITFSMFAYTYNVNPPVGEDGKPLDPSVIPHARVSVKYAPIQATYLYSLDDERQNDSTRGQLKRWSALGCDFTAWTYAANFGNFYLYYPHYQSMSSLLKELKNAHVTYEFDQSLYNENQVYTQYLDAYIFSKLCWDDSLDVNDLAKEFCHYFFGKKGGELVVSFQEEMNNQYAYLEAKGVDLNTSQDLFSQEYFPYVFTERMDGYFTKAIEETNADSSLSDNEKSTFVNHLEMARLSPLYLKMKLAPVYDGVSEEAAKEVAREFFRVADRVGAKRYGEAADRTIASLKTTYGV